MMLIDDREPDWVKNHDWGFKTRVERKTVSDLYIQGGVAIERKEINDMASSLNQRLWEQAEDLEHNMRDEESDVTSAVIIIHGTISDLNRYNMEPRKIEGIYGAVARLIVSYGVSVLWFRDRSQFIKEVKKLHDKGGTKTTKQKPHLSKRTFRDDRINVLYGVEGVGFDTATNLLGDSSPFDSISEIATADVESLQKVPGVGPKTAKTIYDVFHEGKGKLLK